jgi:hypothetical protein
MRRGPRNGVECISSCPSVVMGPLLSPVRDPFFCFRSFSLYIF